MLMPIVATMKVIEPTMVAIGLLIFSTISTGSMMASPKTFIEPPVTITVMIANRMKLTGSPQKLPSFIALSLLAKREKSPKLSSSAAKYATINIDALAIRPIDSMPV